MIRTVSALAGLALGAAFLMAAPARATPIDGTYTKNSLGRTDDGSSAAITLGFSINFFGVAYSTIYVNNNGNVSFGGAVNAYTPAGLSGALTRPMIAPFFADVYTSAASSGIVTYEARAAGIGGRPTFGVEWPRVNYYNDSTGAKQDTFELLIVSRSDISAGSADIYFNYGAMKWETGNASGGVNGLGGSCATAGFSAGSGKAGTFYELPGSGLCGSMIDGGARQLQTATNDGVAGQWLFSMRTGSLIASVSEPGCVFFMWLSLGALLWLRRGRCLLAAGLTLIGRCRMAPCRVGGILPWRLSRPEARALSMVLVCVSPLTPWQAAWAGEAGKTAPVSRAAETVRPGEIPRPAETSRLAETSRPAPVSGGKRVPEAVPDAVLPPMPNFRQHGLPWIFYHAGDAANLSPEGLVGIVEGRNIRVEDIADAIAALPDAMRELPFETLYPMMLEMLVNRAVLVQEAARLEIDNEPATRRRMMRAAHQAMEKELLERLIASKLTEAAIRARYEQRYGGRAGIAELRVRIITLRGFDEAAAVIATLDKGADFASMARQTSIDPSARSGGDLGYVRRERLHPSQAEVVFSLDPGTHAPRPVRDRLGWSVVRVDDRRLSPVPPYEQARPALRQEMTREIIDAEITVLRASTRIRLFNLDGTALEPHDMDNAWHVVAVPK